MIRKFHQLIFCKDPLHTGHFVNPAALLSEFKKHIHRYIPEVGKYDDHYNERFYGLKVSISYSFWTGINIEIQGNLLTTAYNYVSETVGFKSIYLTISFTTFDNAGIDQIKIWKDNSLQFYGGKKYVETEFNFYLSMASTVTIDPSDIVIHIIDVNGNTRVIERTTEALVFTSDDLVRATVLDITRYFDLPDDVVNYVFDEIEEVVGDITDFVNEVLEFLDTVLNFVLDGLKYVWKMLIRYYIDKSREMGIDGRAYLIGIFSEMKGDPNILLDPVTIALNSSYATAQIDNAVEQLPSLRSQLPAIDRDTIISSLGGFSKIFENVFGPDSIFKSAIM
ncbi:MAG: hypothetical protein ACTSW1_12190 [Candidatus Hodarchaeales archaeon]